MRRWDDVRYLAILATGGRDGVGTATWEEVTDVEIPALRVGSELELGGTLALSNGWEPRADGVELGPEASGARLSRSAWRD
jgi:hypothetical protein